MDHTIKPSRIDRFIRLQGARAARSARAHLRRKKKDFMSSKAHGEAIPHYQ